MTSGYLKGITAILSVAIFAQIFTGCGQNGGIGTKGSDSSGDLNGTVAEPQQETEKDNLEGLDFGGEIIKFYTSVSNYDYKTSNDLIEGSGEENGDIVNDSVYYRNMNVEEALNVSLEFIQVDKDWDTIGDDIRKTIMSGDDVYDVVINDLFPLANLSLEGMFANVKGTDYIQFDKKYWYDNYMNDLTIGNSKMFLLAGDFFIDILRNGHALYFNKTLIESLGKSPEEIYTLVTSGKWTIDNFLGYVKLGYKDLNGDSKSDIEDQYGYITVGTWGSAIPFMISSDISFIKRDSKGIPSIAMNNERSVRLLEKLNEVFWDPAAISSMTKEEIITRFANGQSLFVGFQRLGSIDAFRDMKDDMGLLPYPKLDETQKNYITSTHDITEVGAIPVTCQKVDKVCAVLEALSRETETLVLPAYYETALKIKYVRDNVSAQMIDIIHDNISIAFPLAYNNKVNDIFLRKCFSEPLNNKSTDFASAYAAAEPLAIKQLQEVIDTFMENN